MLKYFIFVAVAAFALTYLCLHYYDLSNYDLIGLYLANAIWGYVWAIPHGLLAGKRIKALSDKLTLDEIVDEVKSFSEFVTAGCILLVLLSVLACLLLPKLGLSNLFKTLIINLAFLVFYTFSHMAAYIKMRV